MLHPELIKMQRTTELAREHASQRDLAKQAREGAVGSASGRRGIVGYLRSISSRNAAEDSTDQSISGVAS